MRGPPTFFPGVKTKGTCSYPATMAGIGEGRSPVSSTRKSGIRLSIRSNMLRNSSRTTSGAMQRWRPRLKAIWRSLARSKSTSSGFSNSVSSRFPDTQHKSTRSPPLQRLPGQFDVVHHGAAKRVNGREDAEELLYRVRHQVRRFGKPAPLLGIARQPDEAGRHAGLRRGRSPGGGGPLPMPRFPSYRACAHRPSRRADGRSPRRPPAGCAAEQLQPRLVRAARVPTGSSFWAGRCRTRRSPTG